MANAMIAIRPYRYEGMWVFDDPSAGLEHEPFVFGVPEMIEVFVKDIPDAESGFDLLFSAEPFPGYQARLIWLRPEYEGNWYGWPETRLEGWLCPALFKYFDKAPGEIYCRAEARSDLARSFSATGSLDGTATALLRNIDTRLAKLIDGLRDADQRMANIEARLDRIERKLDLSEVQ